MLESYITILQGAVSLADNCASGVDDASSFARACVGGWLYSGIFLLLFFSLWEIKIEEQTNNGINNERHNEISSHDSKDSPAQCSSSPCYSPL